jgi:predicted MFS family arabinose efflux permease
MIPLFFIRSGQRVEREQTQEKGGRFPFLFVLLLILHVFFGHAVWSVVRVFCPAYMDKSLNLTPLSIGLIVGAGQFVAIGAPFVIPRLSERRGSGWAVMATSVGMIVALIPVVLVRHWIGVGLTTMGLLALSAVWLPVLQIYQMEMVSNRWRSLAYGAVSMALGLSFGFFSLTGGYMAAGGGYRSVFWLGIAFSAAGVLFMGMLLAHFRKR